MADDPYKVLGITRDATAEEVRKAYRAAAKKSHPDLHPGDSGAEQRFKALNAANDLLSDPGKRAAFDRGEIDAEGQPIMPGRSFYNDYAQSQAAGGRYSGGPGLDENDLHDMFGAFFRNQAGASTAPRRGRDRTYRLEVPFLDTVNGATERLTLPDGQSLDVRIPPGLTDGQVLRLRGKGEAGVRGGEAGDALIEVSVFPHTLYRREGTDLVMEVPVTFAEAVRGARVQVPTPRGMVTLAVPARADAGTRLRLRGRGVAAHVDVPAGDLYVVLKIVVGPVDEALEAFLAAWKPPSAPSVRARLEEAA
jgi:DnaJ-class molecular chaperone